MDLSKAFDCMDHELLIAKLSAYGFCNDALLMIYSYLTGRKKRVKINGSFRTCQCQLLRIQNLIIMRNFYYWPKFLVFEKKCL